MLWSLPAIASLAVLIWLFYRHSVARSSRNRAWLTSSVSEAPISEKTERKSNENLTPPPDYSLVNRAYRIADMHFSRGDFEQAEKFFIQVLSLHGEHTEALNRLGVIYIQQGNARRAEFIYRKLFSITQKEPAYYCNYGRCLYAQGRLTEAVEAYENAIKLDATKPSRFVSAGQLHYELKDYAKSLAYFLRALALDPQNRDCLNFTAELAELLGDTERLRETLKKLVEVDPYNESVKTKLAAIQKDSPTP